MGQTQAPFCTKLPLWPEHTPALSGCLHTSRSQTDYVFWNLSSSTQSQSAAADALGWGVQRRGEHPLSWSLSVLPAANQLLCSPWAFSSVQSLSCLRLFVTPMDCSTPGLPSITTPGVYSNSCPLSWWYHPTISSSVIPFSSHLQSFPAIISLRCSLSVPVDLLLFYSSFPGVQVPSQFLFSFVLPGNVVILLVILALWDLPAFSKYSVTIVLHGDVFLMYLWKEVGSMSCIPSSWSDHSLLISVMALTTFSNEPIDSLSDCP